MKKIKLPSKKNGTDLVKFLATVLMVGLMLIHENLRADEGTIYLTPDLLRERISRDGLDLKRSLLQVEQAKDYVVRAKTDLLPSLNLGAVMAGPSGVAASATAFLPFLMPSNWFRLSQTSALFEAQKDGYRIAALNTMADAYGLYIEVLSIQEFHQDLVEHYERLRDLDRLFNEINDRKQVIDIVATSLIRAQMEAARARMTSVESLLMGAKLALAQMIGTEKDIEIQAAHLPESVFENKSADQLLISLQNSTKPAPELLQLDHFIKAAKKGKWADVFAFINGKGATASTSLGGASGLAQFPVSGNVNLGFGIFPTLSLTNHQIQLFELQKNHLATEAKKIIKSTLFAINKGKTEFDALVEADMNVAEAYRLQVERLERDQENVSALVGTLLFWQDVKLRKNKALSNLDHYRVMLERLFVTGVFESMFVSVAGNPLKR